MTTDTALPAALPPDIQEALSTAVSIAVAPERTDDTVAAIPPDRLLAFIWTCDELIRRLHAAKKGAVIETQVAMEHGELPSVHLEVNGHTWRYQQDSKNEIDDVSGLMFYLNSVGASLTDLGGAVGYLRVTDIQRIIGMLPEDVQADAYATLEAHRIRKPTGYALVDLDSKYRKSTTKRTTPSHRPEAGDGGRVEGGTQ